DYTAGREDDKEGERSRGAPAWKRPDEFEILNPIRGLVIPERIYPLSTMAELCAVGEGDQQQRAAARAVLQGIDLDRNLVAGLHDLLVPADPRLLAGGGKLDRPLLRLMRRRIL